MEKAADLKIELHDAEEHLLNELRTLRRGLRKTSKGSQLQLTAGQRIADTVAATMGSWKFIIIQSVILMFWIALNVTAYVQQWDPYPFILLNLALSFQAAYAAPFIMMSQNRQQDIDRQARRARLPDQRQGGARDRASASEDRSAARERGFESDAGGQGAHRVIEQGENRARRGDMTSPLSLPGLTEHRRRHCRA
jgi:hypothetical protein